MSCAGCWRAGLEMGATGGGKIQGWKGFNEDQLGCPAVLRSAGNSEVEKWLPYWSNETFAINY